MIILCVSITQLYTQVFKEYSTNDPVQINEDS